MSRSKIKGKDLKKINYTGDRAKSLAIDIMSRHFKHLSKMEKLDLLQDVLLHPEDYLQHKTLGILAEEFAPAVQKAHYTNYRLRDEPLGFPVYGRKFVDWNTIRQMETAMSLPVAVGGALMPDAHVGFGLPIGGVLATENAIIPYAVGLDIGCRMCLTVYDAPASYLHQNSYELKQQLKRQTHFGVGREQDTREYHEVLDDPLFDSIKPLQHLRMKAKDQLGTSGSGNHFVEWGTVKLVEGNRLGVPAGEYAAILSHSGSRGVGATIASYYTRVAMDTCRLPKHAKSLAWLDMDSEAGQEYWLAMNMAGEYARACHEVIHRKLYKAVGLQPIATVENHHNFAWKEVQANGQELLVHRKGATPAAPGQLGIIPGSMLASGYIVSGRGEEGSLQSASHGAGRKFSRKKAKDSLTKSEMLQILADHGISLIGGGVDESPMAYKDIREVMQSQQDLVDIEGTFHPKIVRMDKN